MLSNKQIVLRNFLGIVFIICFYKNNAQNLVPNGSFENFTTCPNTGAQIYLAAPWFQPSKFSGNIYNSSSSEYFNACNNGIVDMPINFAGTQIALSGQGYAGAILYEIAIGYREYIEVRLTDSLIAGKQYCLSFYVSIAESSAWGVDMIGGYLSNDSLLTFFT